MSTTLVRAEDLIRELDIPRLEQDALAITVIDQATYDAICEVSKRAVALRKKITEEIIGPGKTAAAKSHKEWCALENKLLALCEGAETISKSKINAWEAAQEYLRLQEQYRLEAEARKREEDERLEAAIAAEDDGASPEEAEAILETPSAPVAIVAQRTFERTQGVSRSETWGGEGHDLWAFAQFMVTQNRRDLLNLIQFNGPAVNSIGRAQKSLLNIPGIRAVKGSTIRVRT